MLALIKKWDGDCKVIYGRPRHPQSQGLIEQANGTVENMIAAMMEQEKTKEWSKLLPRIQFNLNTQKSSSTKFMPFEIFLNKKPNFGSNKEFVENGKDGKEQPCVDLVSNRIEENEDENSQTDEQIMQLELSNSNSHGESESESECEKSIEKKRRLLNLNKEKNAEMMIRKHDHKRNKKTREFKVGDNVTVKIPRIDRSGTDLKRLPGKVCKISDHKQKFYHVLTQWGILNDKYQEGNLEPFSGLVDVNLEEYEKNYNPISLTSAASLQSSNTGSKENVITKCNCGTLCKGDNRCKCFKLGQKCTSHCHLKMAKGKKKICKNC